MWIKSAYCFCIFVIKTGPQLALWQLNMSHNDGYLDLNNSCLQEISTRVFNKLVTYTLINWIKSCWFICNKRMIYNNILIACMYYKALIWDPCALVWYVFCWETVFMAGGHYIIQWNVEDSISAWRFSLVSHQSVAPCGTINTSATTHEIYWTG